MDPATISEASKVTLGLGFPGVVILVEAICIVFLTMQLLKSFGERIKATEEQTLALRAAELTAQKFERMMEEASRSRSDIAQFMQEQTKAIASLERSIDQAVTRRSEQQDDLRKLIVEQFERLRGILADWKARLTGPSASTGGDK